MAQAFLVVGCRDSVSGFTTVTYRNKFTKYTIRVASLKSD